MAERNKFDVIVVGAGLIGAAFALKLAANSDYRILVLERSARLTNIETPNQRVLALGNIAIDLLKEVGVFNKLLPINCHPYKKMFVWDEASVGELEFTAQDYDQTVLGCMVDAHSLTQYLQQAIDDSDQVSVKYEQTIESLQINSDSATLGEFSAPLVVAADGTHSWCRQQAKIFVNRVDYQQKGIVTLIRTEQIHDDTAWQIFLKTGPLGLLPLADNQCSIVWSADNDLADQLLGLSESDFAVELKNALQGKLGNIDVLSKRQAFPLVSMQAQTYFKHRLVLIGDAAHAIHPLAGQGANLGFKDIVALVEQLLKDSEIDSLGNIQVLARYQRSRKADNEQTDLMMNALHRAYQSDSGVWPALRGAGMNWVSRSERIKSVLVKQAMG